MTTLTTAVMLTDRTAMERLFSAAGVQAFSDHNELGESDDDVIDDAIIAASEDIMQAIWNRYSAAGIQTSRLIHRWATLLACYHLCITRGNDFPASWSNELERMWAELEKIANGKSLHGVPLRGDLRPTWSNLQVDRRFPRSKVRVVRQTTAPVASTQNIKPADQVVVYDG